VIDQAALIRDLKEVAEQQRPRDALKLFAACENPLVVPLAFDRDSSGLTALRAVIDQIEKPAEASKLSVSEFCYLELGRGLWSLHRECHQVAEEHFKLAQTLGGRLANLSVAAIAGYSLACLHYRTGSYQSALDQIRTCKELLSDHLAHQDSKRAAFLKAIAVIDLIEAWVVFIQGNLAQAQGLLERSSRELEGEDALVRSNALSFEGRIFRRTGDYNKAIDKLNEAIGLLSGLGGKVQHVNLVRCHAQLAFARLLLARREREHASALQRIALNDLEEAERIFYQLDHKKKHRLLRVYYVRAFYHLDTDAFESAYNLAAASYGLAHEINDSVMMAHAQIMMAKSRIRARMADPTGALQLADKAATTAQSTTNRRVKARASICRAMALLSFSSPDLAESKKALEEARSLVHATDNDFLRDEFAELQSESATVEMESDNVATVGMGVVQEKGLEETLRQVTEQIIRRTLPLARNSISDTAKLLKTSRSRVRRHMPSDVARRGRRAPRPSSKT
jgi:tetratricopeptide (TPR) repeat protein